MWELNLGPLEPETSALTTRLSHGYNKAPKIIIFFMLNLALYTHPEVMIRTDQLSIWRQTDKKALNR